MTNLDNYFKWKTSLIHEISDIKKSTLSESHIIYDENIETADRCWEEDLSPRETAIEILKKESNETV